MSFLRSSLAILCISTFAFVSCSKDEEKPDNQIQSSNLMNKAWVGNSIDVKIDGKNYTANADKNLSFGQFTFKEDGTFTLISPDDENISGKWTLNNNSLKLTYFNTDFTFTIGKLDSKDLSFIMGKDIDLTKDEDKYSFGEQLALIFALPVLMNDDVNVDEAKKMDVTLNLKAK